MVRIRDDREAPVDFYQWLEANDIGLRIGEHVKSIGGFYVALDEWDITDGYMVGGGTGRGSTVLMAIQNLAITLEDKTVCKGSSSNGTLKVPQHFRAIMQLPLGAVEKLT